MDMVQATGGSGGLSSASLTTASGSHLSRPPKSDSNWPSVLHALALCGTFILLMPTGVIFLRVVPQSVRWHWMNQSLATALAIIGGLLGLYLSTMFTKAESFSASHQILGILVILAVMVQWGLGFWHHRLYRMTQVPSKYGAVHRYFGPVVIAFAIVNGGIGLTWSSASSGIVIGYAVVIVIVGVVVVGAVVWKRWSAGRDGKGAWSRASTWAQPETGFESNVHLTQYPDTAYHAQYNRL